MKTSIKKKLSALALALCVILTVCPPLSVTAGAAVSTEVSGNLQTAIDNAESGAVLKLTADITENVIITGKRITIDLNGHVLRGDGVIPTEQSPNHSVITLASSASLTIKDSNSTSVHYYKVAEEQEIFGFTIKGLWKLQSGTPEYDYTFSASEGLLNKDGSVPDAAPSEGSVIQVYGGCVTGGTGHWQINKFKNELGYGGGLYVPDDCSLTLQGGIVAGNACKVEGGGIFAKNLTVEGGAVCGNGASSGGGICAVYSETGSVSNCIIACNYSDQNGGGICNFDGTLKLTGGSVSFNTAAGFGGGVYCECLFGGSGITVIETKISANEAAEDGGGLCITDADKNVISNAAVTGNSADGNGGGICLINGKNVKLEGCTVQSNKAAQNGGGVFVDKTSVFTMEGGTISRNTADSDNLSGGAGGGIYIDAYIDSYLCKSARVTVSNVTISFNTAPQGGGIGMAEAGQLLADGCAITQNTAAAGSGGGIYKPGGGDAVKEGNYGKCALFNTVIRGNTAMVNGGGVYFQKYYDSCFAAGTLITMEDGTLTPIENIAAGDRVRTFDHESGGISSAEVYLAYRSETQAAPFTLTFDDGTALSVTGCHDLLERSAREYVTLTEENAGGYIGSSFYGQDGQWHRLLTVSRESAERDYYSIYTAGYQNCFANGMLSVPDDMDYVLNLYQLDENLRADAAQLRADIAEYGTMSYEYTYEKTGMSREWYQATRSEYLFVAVGKGLITWEEVLALYDSAKPEESASAAESAAAAESITATATTVESTTASASATVTETATASATASETATVTESTTAAESATVTESVTESAFAAETATASDPSTASASVSSAVSSSLPKDESEPLSMLLRVLGTAKAAEISTPSLNDIEAGVLVIASGTVIEENYANGTLQNVYLINADSSESSLISLYGTNHSGVNVGVTTAVAPTYEKPVRFTVNGVKTDEAYFFPDNPKYADQYNSAGYLQLVLGYAITDNTTDKNGTVKVQSSAYEGENVTVTLTPAEGYETDTLYYDDGVRHEITPVSGTYSFTMPAKDVSIIASFKEPAIPPKTADTSNIALYAGIMFTALLVLIGAKAARTGRKAG